MSRYETYKPSGIDWIGEIPKDWNIKRLKEIANVETGNTPSTSNPDFYSEEGIPWIKPDNLNDFIELTDSAEKLSENGIKEARVVRKGAVLVCCIGTIGKIGIAGCDLATNQQINSVEFYNKRILDNYGKYLLYISEPELVKQSNKVVVSILNKIKQSQIKFPIPSIEEQLTIANYLDNQTQKIDRLIANKKAQVEKLKELRQIEINNAVTKGLNPNAEMKDSGIEWLGKIPKHWEVKRLKNLANQISEKSSEILDDDFLVALENIESHTGKFIETASEYENNGIKFKKDNLLYNKLRPYLNKVFLADKDGICVGDIIVIECTTKLYPAFLQFRMLSDSFCSMIMSSVYGAKMPRTSWQFISSLKIAYPTYEEQVQIVEHLNKRTLAIERLIQNVNQQIEKLQELRKIKIYEAVTGKIKVNAYAETTA